MDSFVEYQEMLDGKYNRRRPVHPFGAYVMARGGSYSTNQFADQKLLVTPSHLKNLVEIIKSGRRQGFLGLDIVIADKLLVRVSVDSIALLQRVNLTTIASDPNAENWANHWRIKAQYPELVFEEKVLRGVRSHTRLHKRFMDREDVNYLHDGIEFQERMTQEQKQLFLRAMELDGDPFIDTDDVYG